MSTNAKPGIGAILKWWDTTPTAAWKEIVEITNLSWDGASRESIEVFKLNNGNDYVNKVQGIMNSNTLTATVLYTEDQFKKLKTLMETRGNIDFQIILPDGEGIEFEGFITELPLDISADDVMQGDITIEIDDIVDLVAVATTTAPA